MQQTKKQLFYEIFRYLLVGGIATIFDYAVWYVFFTWVLPTSLVGAVWSVIISTAMGFLAGLLVNWMLSLTFVFKQVQNKEEARSSKSFLIFAANLAVALLCFWYCYAKDYEYQELTTTVFGTYNVWRINWLWYIFGIAFIVFVIRTVDKLLDLRAAYKRYCNIK